MTDDELHGIDLSAWEAPEPPDDLADAVLARMQGTAVSLALPVEPTTERRRWLAGGVAAAAIAASVGVWALVHSTRPAVPYDGAVVAERARRVELPGASAMLDVGADVRWHRDHDRVRAEQRAGSATWTVGDEPLRIDAGAAVASVEASGASLRVEVHMNMADKRVIGASAVTAAVVSLVTVVVYDGHVKVDSGGQTVIVQPGTTVEFGPGQVPKEPSVVGAAPSHGHDDIATEVELAAGESATIHDRGERTLVHLDIYGTCEDHAVTMTSGEDGPRLEPLQANVFVLHAGTYRYELGGCKIARLAHGSITVTPDAGGPVTLATPADGSAWTDEVDVTGTAIAGTGLSTSPDTDIEIDDTQKFDVSVPSDQKNVFVLRALNAQTGLHFYVRRSAAVHAATTAATGPAKRSIAILGLEAVGGHDADAVARDLTDRLRDVGAKFLANGYSLKPGSEQPLASEKTKHACKDERLACMREIANELGVDVLMYGRLQQQSGGFEITLTLLDFKTKESWSAAETLKSPALPGLHELAVKLYLRLTTAPTTFDFSGGGSASSDSAALENECKTARDKRAWLDLLNCSNKLSAVSPKDAAAFCAIAIREQQNELTFAKIRDAMAVHNLNVAKKLLDTIDKDSVYRAAAVAAMRECDSELEAADQAYEIGQYQAALNKYEAAYKCAPSKSHLLKVFMASCSANNVAKAKTYWAKLSEQDQARLIQICTRAGIKRSDLDDH